MSLLVLSVVLLAAVPCDASPEVRVRRPVEEERKNEVPKAQPGTWNSRSLDSAPAQDADDAQQTCAEQQVARRLGSNRGSGWRVIEGKRVGDGS